jgi:hypothetical protein
VFEEKFQHKQSKRKEQKAEEYKESGDQAKEFDIVVKAKNPKRRISTIVRLSLIQLCR